jgi:hypothetical protein
MLLRKIEFIPIRYSIYNRWMLGYSGELIYVHLVNICFVLTTQHPSIYYPPYYYVCPAARKNESCGDEEMSKNGVDYGCWLVRCGGNGERESWC